MSMKLTLLLSLLSFTLGAPIAVGAGSNALHISFDGLGSSDGYLVIALYDDPVAFASYSEDAVAFGAVPARPDAAISFHGLPAGRYAIRAFHDEDGDGDLGMDQGYPIEGYATSNASGRFDDPDFEEAVLTTAEVSLRIYYLN